jgi:hypothetical protein
MFSTTLPSIASALSEIIAVVLKDGKGMAHTDRAIYFSARDFSKS